MLPTAAEPDRPGPAGARWERWVARADLTVVHVDGRAVVYDPVADALHRLDEVGTAVWDHLDGSPVEAVVARLGELTGRDPEEIAGGVLTLVGELRGRRLLQPAGGPVRPRRPSRAPTAGPGVTATRAAAGVGVYEVYEAHGWRFAVSVPDPGMRAAVGGLLAPLAAGRGAAEHVYRLEPRPAPGEVLRLCRDGEVVGVRDTPAELLDLLAWDVNQQAVRCAAPERLLLHAAAAAAGDAGVLLCGPSGAGKSTLVGLLVRAGADYLTDELVAVDRRSGMLLGYPRALSLRPSAAALFPEQAGRHLPPALLGGGAVRRTPVRARLLLLIERAPGASRVDPLEGAEALGMVLEQTFGWKETAADTLPVLAAVVAGCECRRLTVGDDWQAGPLVEQLVRAYAAATTTAVSVAASGPVRDPAAAWPAAAPDCRRPSADRRS